MFVVIDARLAPIACAISAPDCSGGSQTINQPKMRPVIGGRPYWSWKNVATRSTHSSNSVWIGDCRCAPEAIRSTGTVDRFPHLLRRYQLFQYQLK